MNQRFYLLHSSGDANRIWESLNLLVYQLNAQFGKGDHGALSGLSDDDHPQYLLMSGRKGSQVVYGGIASGERVVFYPNRQEGSHAFSVEPGEVRVFGSSPTLAFIDDAGEDFTVFATGNEFVFRNRTDGVTVFKINTSNNLDASGRNIDNVADPTTAQQAATKAYVDAKSAGASRMAIDDFLGGALVSGSVGDLGWQINGTGSNARVNPEEEHPGVHQVSSGSTAGNARSISLPGGIHGSATMTATLIVKMTSNPGDTKLKLGFSSVVTDADITAGETGAFFLWNGSAFLVVTINAGLGTVTTLTQTLTTWTKLTIGRTAGACKFYRDGLLVANHTTNLPTGTMYPAFIVETISTGGTLQIDLYQHTMGV